MIDALARRSVVGQAVTTLVKRYRATPGQALTYLEAKARQDDRSVADVAAEILERQSQYTGGEPPLISRPGKRTDSTPPYGIGTTRVI